MKKVFALFIILVFGGTLTLKAQVVGKKPKEPTKKITQNRC